MTDRLHLIEFGRQLLDSKDLDPVYILLQESGMDRPKLWRWLIAYWCFYHVGTASYLSENKVEAKYWDAMAVGAASQGNATHPRSPERRHFRGANAINSIEYLRNRGLKNLTDTFDYRRQANISYVMGEIQKWVGFGPWIAFKVADMVERLGLFKVNFGHTEQFIYDSPARGADLAWGEYGEFPPDKPVGSVITWALDYILQSELAYTLAPPRYERTIGIQEAETILCKWYSHMHGGYHVGEDIESCRKGLLRFSKCRTAQLLLSSGKRGGLWD